MLIKWEQSYCVCIPDGMLVVRVEISNSHERLSSGRIK